jgi:molybdate-binding protein
METRDFMKHINITRENLRLAIVNKIYEKDYVQALAEFIEEFGDHDHE